MSYHAFGMARTRHSSPICLNPPYCEGWGYVPGFGHVALGAKFTWGDTPEQAAAAECIRQGQYYDSNTGSCFTCDPGWVISADGTTCVEVQAGDSSGTDGSGLSNAGTVAAASTLGLLALLAFA